MRPAWKPGDIAVVVTVDRGLPSRPNGRKPPTEQAWAARLIGPSVLGQGWWLVHKLDAKTGKGAACYTVPETEMHKP